MFSHQFLQYWTLDIITQGNDVSSQVGIYCRIEIDDLMGDGHEPHGKKNNNNVSVMTA